MRNIRRIGVVLVIAGASLAGVGAWWTLRPTGAATAFAATVYACPMHPQYRSDHPGDCGSCGMRLEPVRQGEGGGEKASRRGTPPGTVQVNAERQQAIGVRLGTAERVSGRRTLRTSGRVVPNENATYPIIAGVSGWIRSVGQATTGSHVRKDEVLASFYAPEFVIAQQSYYSSLEVSDSAATAQIQTHNQQRVVEALRRFADQLRNLGVSESQLAVMTKKRELVQDIHVTAPIQGFVLQRNASTGLRFDRGFELYRIADLSRVWILADVYQHQLPFIQPGMPVRVTTSQVDHEFSATVSRSEPSFDQETLTLQVRLETDNPRSMLKPGMFVDVEFAIDVGEALVVPAEAIADSGLRKTVFVDLGEGYFEPRQVETGWRIADLVQVTKGLMPGERIVISGTFLIDSESRMKAAAQGIFGETAEDPVCGMQVDVKRAAAASRVLERDGRAYYFCADACRHSFEQHPEKYVRSEAPRATPAGKAPPAAAHLSSAHATDPPAAGTAAAEPATATDPICHMAVVPKEARAAGLVSERDGETHYFCSDVCKKRFDAGDRKR